MKKRKKTTRKEKMKRCQIGYVTENFKMDAIPVMLDRRKNLRSYKVAIREEKQNKIKSFFFWMIQEQIFRSQVAEIITQHIGPINSIKRP